MIVLLQLNAIHILLPNPAGLEVRISVIPNFELERLILSFGEQVKVIAPEDFRERLAQRIKSASNPIKRCHKRSLAFIRGRCTTNKLS